MKILSTISGILFLNYLITCSPISTNTAEKYLKKHKRWAAPTALSSPTSMTPIEDCSVLIHEIAPVLGWNIAETHPAINAYNCCNHPSSSSILSCDKRTKTTINALYLFQKNFKGSLPTSMVKLKNLQILWLNNNELSGEIPSNWGEFNALRVLYLHFNNLTGDIPSSIFNLRQLSSLYLHENFFNVDESTIQTAARLFSQLDYFQLDPQKVDHSFITSVLHEDLDEECTICLEKLLVGDSIAKGRRCSHKFHEICASEWFIEMRRSSCPTCRSRFI